MLDEHRVLAEIAYTMRHIFTAPTDSYLLNSARFLLERCLRMHWWSRVQHVFGSEAYVLEDGDHGVTKPGFKLPQSTFDFLTNYTCMLLKSRLAGTKLTLSESHQINEALLHILYDVDGVNQTIVEALKLLSSHGLSRVMQALQSSFRIPNIRPSPLPMEMSVRMLATAALRWYVCPGRRFHFLSIREIDELADLFACQIKQCKTPSYLTDQALAEHFAFVGLAGEFFATAVPEESFLLYRHLLQDILARHPQIKRRPLYAAMVTGNKQLKFLHYN